MQVKTLLTVLAIVTAVGFVAANSVTQQASAWGSGCTNPGGQMPGGSAGSQDLNTPGHTPCVSSHVPNTYVPP